MSYRSSFNRYRKGMHRATSNSSCHSTNSQRSPEALLEDEKWLRRDTDTRQWLADDLSSFKPCQFKEYCHYDDKRKKQMSRRPHENSFTQTEGGEQFEQQMSEELDYGHAELMHRAEEAGKTSKAVLKMMDSFMNGTGAQSLEVKSEMAQMRASMDQLTQSNELVAREIGSLRELILDELPKKVSKMVSEAFLAMPNDCFVMAPSSSGDRRSMSASSIDEVELDHVLDSELEVIRAENPTTGADAFDQSHSACLAASVQRSLKVGDELEEEQKRVKLIDEKLGFNYTPKVDLNMWLINHR